MIYFKADSTIEKSIFLKSIFLMAYFKSCTLEKYVMFFRIEHDVLSEEYVTFRNIIILEQICIGLLSHNKWSF